VGLLNVAGYFDALLAWVDRAVQEGFLRAEHRQTLLVAREVEGLLEALLHAPAAPATRKWIDADQR
jgi:predicted Rossmann-fold nucleotide-binding protein